MGRCYNSTVQVAIIGPAPVRFTRNFLRMLGDVKQDKVDLILFTRLDRWFRSVADYYKVMEILKDDCRVLRHYLQALFLVDSVAERNFAGNDSAMPYLAVQDNADSLPAPIPDTALTTDAGHIPSERPARTKSISKKKL